MQSALYCCASGMLHRREHCQRFLVVGGIVERLGFRQRLLRTRRRRNAQHAGDAKEHQVAGGKAARSSLPHIHGDAVDLFQCDQRVHAPFAELRVAEDDLMLADRLQQIGERRLANARAVDEDLGPRDGVDAQRVLAANQPIVRRLTRRYTDCAGGAKTKRIGRQFELVLSTWQHDSFHVTRPDQPLSSNTWTGTGEPTEIDPGHGGRVPPKKRDAVVPASICTVRV